MSDDKTITASYQPCVCTDPQPADYRMDCGCRKCVTCGGDYEWTHDDSL